MIEITPHNLHWSKNVPTEYNFYVYGGFTLSFDQNIIIDAKSEELTLSAAVIYLLRTIEKNHSFGTKICEHLIPECADMYLSNLGNVEFITCPFGIDWWVEHTTENVTLIFQHGKEITTTLRDYIRAVLKFADKIKVFYDEGGSKKYNDEEDRKAFEAFNREWNMRVERVSKLL